MNMYLCPAEMHVHPIPGMTCVECEVKRIYESDPGPEIIDSLFRCFEFKSIEDYERFIAPHDQDVTIVKDQSLQHEQECDQCGTTFIPKNKKARFCSTKCRVKAHRKASPSEALAKEGGPQ